MDRPFVAENKKERERLSSLVGNLTDEELTFQRGLDSFGEVFFLLTRPLMGDPKTR